MPQDIVGCPVLADFDMKIEYLHGTDNKVADALSWVESRLDEEETKEFLDTIVTEKSSDIYYQKAY